MTRRYQWRPDIPDHRDWLFTAKTGVDLPKIADLRAMCPPVYDQGQLGSCTANGLAAAVQFEHRKQGIAPDVVPSRLFIYYNERAIEGTVGSDSGAQIRDGVKSLAKIGVCPETEWPYAVAKYRSKPAAKCFSDAASAKISSYSRLTTLNDMLHCLADGYPFVFGFTVYDGFESDQVAKTGVLNLPAHGEKMLGGHAVAAVGYNLDAKRFIVRNSWGSGWGMAGYFTMPFDYLTSRNLSDDFWTIRK